MDDTTYLNYTVQVMTVDDKPLFHVLVTPYVLHVPSAQISPLDPSENALEWREMTNTSVMPVVWVKKGEKKGEGEKKNIKQFFFF